jgi:hypothetical protein
VTQIHLSSNATASAVAFTFSIRMRGTACFGDDPSTLRANGQILAGNEANTSTYFYYIATNTWTFAASKVHDRSDEQGWAKLADGNE